MKSPYSEPYVEIFGFYQDQKSNTYYFPIVYNEHLETFEAQGIWGLRIIKITYHWENKEKDILEMKRRLLQKQREEWKRVAEQYRYSRITKRGRANYDETILAAYNDNNSKRLF